MQKVTHLAVLCLHSCPLGKVGTQDVGGMNVYLREVSRVLGKQGLKVDMFTRDTGAAERTVVSLGKNVRLIHIKAGPPKALPKSELYPYALAFAREIEGFRKFHGLSYNTIFSNYWISAVAGAHLQHWWQVKHVLMYHTLGTQKELVVAGKEDAACRIATEKSLSQSCHRIIAPTQTEKDLIVRSYPVSPSKIGVVPCGVNLERFYPMERSKAKAETGLHHDTTILYVGRVKAEKGPLLLLDALALMPVRRRPHLVLLGGDEEENSNYQGEMRRKCRELSLEKNVTFLESVTHEKLLYYYNAADLCAITSYYESFCMVALEALACGTPVVATDVGVLRQIIEPGESGYVVPVGDYHKMADKIDEVLKGNLEKDPYAIRQNVMPYGWRNVALKLMEEFFWAG